MSLSGVRRRRILGIDTVAGNASSGREHQGWPTAAMGCPSQDKPAALIGCPADTLIWDGASKRQNPHR